MKVSHKLHFCINFQLNIYFLFQKLMSLCSNLHTSSGKVQVCIIFLLCFHGIWVWTFVNFFSFSKSFNCICFDRRRNFLVNKNHATSKLRKTQFLRCGLSLARKQKHSSTWKLKCTSTVTFLSFKENPLTRNQKFIENCWQLRRLVVPKLIWNADYLTKLRKLKVVVM